MPYTWNSALETRHTTIDNQHKQWIAAVSALFDAHENGQGRQGVEKTLDFLLGYTVKHFADEEALQEQHNYSEYYEHKRLHAEFKRMVQEIIAAVPQEGSVDAFVSEVYVTISEWVVNHIKGDDFKMAVYVRNKEQII